MTGNRWLITCFLGFILSCDRNQDPPVQAASTSVSRSAEAVLSETEVKTDPAQAESRTETEAAPRPAGELLYSQRSLSALVGVAIEPLLATPGFSKFRSDPVLPKGLVLDATTGSILGAATEAGGSTLYRISADRLGLTGTTELTITVFAGPMKPQPPISASSFTSKAELSFQWTPPSTSPLGAHIVSYQAQLVRYLPTVAEPVLMETQKTSLPEVSFNAIEEGTYALRIQSFDSLGQASPFSEFSSRIVVDRTAPIPALILRVLTTQYEEELAFEVQLSPASDGQGSTAENLRYFLCYGEKGCELDTKLSDLPNVQGSTTLYLNDIRTLSNEMYFRIITQDEAGNTSLSAVHSISINRNTGPNINEY